MCRGCKHRGHSTNQITGIACTRVAHAGVAHTRVGHAGVVHARVVGTLSESNYRGCACRSCMCKGCMCKAGGDIQPIRLEGLHAQGLCMQGWWGHSANQITGVAHARVACTGFAHTRVARARVVRILNQS